MTESKKSRLQLDITEEMLLEIEDVMLVCRITSKKDLFNNAFTLWQWAIEQARAGREIVSASPKRDDFEILKMPAIEAARKKKPNAFEPSGDL